MRKYFIFCREGGFGLFDLLIAIFLSTLLISLMLPVIFQSSKLVLQQKEKERLLTATRSVELYLRRYLDSLDNHRFALPPIVSYTGNSITLINIDSNCGVIPIERTDSSITLCAISGELCPANKWEQMLGFSLEDNTEFAASVVYNSDNCMTLSKIATDLESTDKFIKTVARVYPITEKFSLELDGDGSLRFISHGAKGVKENQPLVEKLDKLSFNLTTHYHQQIYEIGVQLEVSTTTKGSLFLSHHLGRLSNLQLLAYAEGTAR